MKRRDRIFSFAAICCAIGLLVASTGGASAACFGQGQQVSQQEVDKFLANPAQFLADSPNGGAAMISALRDLVASNPATLGPVLALLANANAAQKGAIGTALGQAAQACIKPDPTFATQIQQQLAATNDQPAIVAFAAVVGDRPIGAVGGGAGGGGGGAVSGGANGGQTSALSTPSSSGGGLQTFSSSSTPTTADSFSAAGLAGGSTTTTTTTTTTIINNVITSVSP